MAQLPFPLTATDLDETKAQLWEILRQVYEEKVGGAELGDVFSIPGDVLTLVLADSSGLTKTGNELAIDSIPTGGIQINAGGLSIKIVNTGGLRTGSSGISIKCKSGGGLATDADGIYLSAPVILSTITGIDAKVIGTTNLYTVPTGKSIVITNAIIRVTVADTITVVPTLGIGIAAGESDIVAPVALTGLDATTEYWRFSVEGIAKVAGSGEVIKLGIDTGATATTMTIAVELIGYLLPVVGISTASITVSSWTGSSAETPASNAGDNNDATYYSTSDFPSPTIPWIRADLGTATTVASIKLWSKADGATGVGGGAAVRVKDFTLYWSDDDAAWTSVQAFQHTNTDGEETFAITSPSSHRYWKVIVNSKWNNDGSWVRIHELKFYGD